MEFTFLKTGNFKVHELFADSDGAKVITGNVELRIYHKVAGVAWEIYDWNDSTFKSGAPATEKDDCTVITAGAVATGLWQNDTAIDFSVFVAGDSYVFEFFDADNSVIIASSGIQYSGQYGDIAKQTTVALDATVSKEATAAKDSTVAKDATVALDSTVSKESTAAKDSTVAKETTLDAVGSAVIAVGNAVGNLNDPTAAAIVTALMAKVIDDTRTFEQIIKSLNAVFRATWNYDSGTQILTLTFEDATTLVLNFATANQRTTS